MPLKQSAQRVEDALRARGMANRVRELPASTRSAAEAAAAVGCPVRQIVKSLLFRMGAQGSAVLVLASGENRVDTDKLGALLGEPVERASPDFVREQTGFAIGGVPPLGHAKPITLVIDETLLRQERLFAAAGHPHALFELTPDELLRITEGRVAAIAL
ncbi:MAG TPA: YbaK/EbsC family protein [Anaeromyxobacteraceae bacterium]|nr:YbaK/EbsC family protein [Anaeromyxobacteraceae bacterium]